MRDRAKGLVPEGILSWDEPTKIPFHTYNCIQTRQALFVLAPSLQRQVGMTTRRSVQLIGAIYCLMSLIGTLAHSSPVSVLLFSFHLMIGIWAILASQYIVSAIRFSRKAAVLLSLLVLVELLLPLPTLFRTWSWIGIAVPIVHLATALATAYYGYYWTDAVVEADRREAVKTA